VGAYWGRPGAIHRSPPRWGPRVSRTDPALLAISDCAVRLGRNAILAGADLEVRGGEIVGLVGENGSGKTTLLRVAVGLIRPQAGSVRLFDGNPREPRNLRRVGAALDAPALYPWMSGRSVLLTLLHLAGESDDGRSATALAKFGLSHVGRKPVIRYSQGMKKRLALAAASLREPQLLVLDEPTNGLDADGRNIVAAWLHEQTESGGAAVIASHRAAELSLCDRLIRLEDGRTADTSASEWARASGAEA
jgi:ABC-type multidrug transport system ATPase subunit